MNARQGLARTRLEKLARQASRRRKQGPIQITRGKREPLVLMDLQHYAELLSYKRQARTWAELTDQERKALQEAIDRKDKQT